MPTLHTHTHTHRSTRSLGHHRLGPCGNEYVLGCVFLVANGDLPRSSESGVTFDVLHIVLLEVVEVDAIQPLHVVITTLLHSTSVYNRIESKKYKINLL